MSISEQSIRESICKAGLDLLEKGYVTGTWGNISHRVDDRMMAITPSGKNYEDIQPEHIVLVDYRHHSIHGDLPPSSEYKLHSEIYRSRKKIRAVVHTHQLQASVLAVAGRDVPPILDDMAQIIGPSVRVAKYLPSNSSAIAKAAVKALKGRYAAIMANHGAVCIGRSMEEAFLVCEVLEKSCRVYIEAQSLGGATSIDKKYARKMHRDYLNHYSKLKG